MTDAEKELIESALYVHENDGHPSAYLESACKNVIDERRPRTREQIFVDDVRAALYRFDTYVYVDNYRALAAFKHSVKSAMKKFNG